MDDFHLAMIAELIKARDRVEEAEVELKELKQAVSYFEEVFLLSGEKQFKNELGTVSIGETEYAYVAKKDFTKMDALLGRVFNVSMNDFLEKTLTLTKQKKLAKLFATKKVKIPESVKIFPKPTIRLRKKKVKERSL